MKKAGREKISILFIIALIILVISLGIIIFRVQYGMLSKNQIDSEEYTYDSYYAFIAGDDSDFWNEVYEGARDYGEKDNVYVEKFGSDLATGYSEAQRIEIAVAAGVDGIIAEGGPKSSLKKALKKADEAGIPVVLVGEDMRAIPRISFVGVGQYDMGEMYGVQATALSKKILNNKDNVKITVLSSSSKLTEGEKLIISAIRKVVSSDEDLYGRVTVDSYPIGDDGLFSSQETVYDFLMEKDVPDVIIALSEEHTVSAYQAVVDLNLAGVCNIIGSHDSDTIRNAIKNEVIYSTVATDTTQYGEYAIYAMEEYDKSGNVSEYFAVDNIVLDRSALTTEVER
ncbi:MAG: substrate-binding domain-containing protein [Lachnospiraceae bacterium]|nr:substrate-binding domain-containing protein [Lachnospiraceae bacterium]